MDRRIRRPVIMIVDDVEANTEYLQAIVEELGYETRTALSVREAIFAIEMELPHLILLDIMMPEINGFQFCEMLKENRRTREIPVIFVSAMNGIEDREKAASLGAVDFVMKPFVFSEIKLRVNTHLRIYQMQMELEHNNHMLNQVVSEQAELLREERKRAFRLLKEVMTVSDCCNEQKSHLENVSYNARILAQGLNFSSKYDNKISEEFVEAMEIASGIHDIGLIGKGKEENHTTFGYDILENVYYGEEDDFIVRTAEEIIMFHHERWDGGGTPKGIRGEEIPLSARIFAVVDFFDQALQENNETEITEMIKEERGKSLEPDIVDVFLKIQKLMKKSENYDRDGI